MASAPAGRLRGDHHRPLRVSTTRSLLDSAKLIVDTRNAMKGFESEKIVRLVELGAAVRLQGPVEVGAVRDALTAAEGSGCLHYCSARP